MLICIAAFTVPLSGQTVLKAWDFDGFDGDEGPTLATFNATGIGATTGNVRRALGISAFPAGPFDNVYISRDFDNTTLAGAQSASEYVKISIRPEAGFGLQLTELTIQIGRQGNGPNEFALFTDAGGDNFITQIGAHTSTIAGTGSYETVTFDLTTTGLFDNCTTSSDAISFRLYGYGSSVDPAADFNRFWFGNGLVDGTNDIEISGYVAAIPDAPTNPGKTVEFCEGAGNSDRLLRLISPSPIDGSGDQVVVWVVQSAPAAAGLTVGQEFMPPCSAPGSYTDANFFLSGTNDNSIRLQPTAPVGDYVFSAKVLNCNTGCESELSKETYTISKKADPVVSITADPTGDVCLNTLGVQYDPNLTATDGGTYSYAWCAYNNGAGSGFCFPGFDDNTAAMPTRDWVSSTGARSVGVTVSSTTPGCEASDLYSFTVNPNPSAPTESAKTKEFCEGAPSSDRLLRLINPSPITGDQVVVWVLQSAPAGVALAEYNPPCSVPGSFTSPDGFFFLSGTNDNSIRLEPAAPVGDYVFKAKVLDCATGCTSDLSAESYTITKYANPAAPAVDQATVSYCVPESSTSVRQLRTQVPSGADELVVWILTDAPAGSQFDGSEPVEFMNGEVNNEFRITGGSKGEKLTMRGVANGNPPAVYGSWSFDVKTVNTSTGCESTPVSGYTATALESPGVTINKFMQNPFNEVCVGTEARFLASADASGPPSVMTYDWTFSGSPSVMQYGQTASDNATKRNQGATYAGTGTETVNLTVTYDNGCSVDAPTHTVTVNPLPSGMFRPAGTSVSFPFSEDLDFDADHNACPGDVFEYGTQANTASINTVSWTLSGGGNILAGENARNIQIEWTTPGTHTLSFLVTNNATGCTATNSLDVTVQDAPAITIGSFDNNPFDEVCEGDQAIFLASASSSGPPPVANYNWSFSGSPAEEPGAGTGGTGQLASDNTPRRIGATWVDAGSETVDLMVTYDNGCSVEAPTHTVTVNPLPTVGIQQFAGNPFAEVCSGGTGVYLANLGNPVPGGNVNTYSWSVSPAAPITLAGQSGDVSGRRRAEIAFPPNMGTAPVMYTVELTIEDANGCVNTATQIVKVLPAPEISCPGNITVQTSNNGNGDCTADASWKNPTETAGACSPVTLTISIDNGTPQTVVQGEPFTTTLSGGEHTITYVVTDGNNNQDDCSFTVTVEDDERPSSIALPDVALSTDVDGAECPGAANTSLIVDQVNPIATAADSWSYFVHGVEIDGFNDITDNCSDPSEIEIFVWEINEISTDACESSFKVFFRYYDEAGNWRQRGKEFTIVDDTQPSSIALQDMTFTTEDGATCPGAADTDLVVDQSNPIATAADNWSFTVHGQTVQGFNNITDNCSAPSEIEIFVWEINEIATGDCESSFKVFFRYFDACGNFRQRGQTFTIQDNTKPDFSKGGFSEAFTLTTEDGADCPANATVDGLETGDVLMPGVAAPFTVAGVAYTTPTDMVSDNCVAQSDLLLTVDVVNEDVMNEGDDCSKLLRVRYKLEDGCGNQRFFTQEFTVTDNTKPDFNKGGFSEAFTLTTEDGADCPANATVDGLETGDVLTPSVAVPFTVAGVAYTTPTDMVSDNCVAQSDLLLTVDVVNEDVMNEGDDCSKLLRVRYKLEDGCGNQRFFTQEFTVTDNTKPDFAVPADITIYTDEDCEFDASVAETGDATDITDNCATGLEVTYSDEIEAGDCEGEQVITRTWSLTDDCGNETTKVQIITVEDNIDPEFTVPDNTNVFTDANCGFNADPSKTGDVEDESDNCTTDLDATYSDEIETGDCEGEQVITRTWSLIDDCGNETTKVQIITVKDLTDPTAICLENVIIPLNPDGERTLVAEDVFDFSASFDNCSTVSVTDISPAIVDCDDVGGLTSVEVTATDDCGNESTCIATIEVSDITDLPAPWEGVDIGNPGSGSTYSYNPCVEEFIIDGGAYNIPSPSDNLATISQTLCSNGKGLVGIQLKVESVSGGFGGVFIRESNAPDAKYAALLRYNNNNLLSWERRASTGGNLDFNTYSANFPFWLRIFRKGNLIRAEYSNTGNHWIPNSQIYLEMDDCVEVGMVAYTNDPNGTVDAVFSNVQVAGSSTAGTSSLAVDQGNDGVVPDMDYEAGKTAGHMDLSVFPNPATDQLTLKFGTEIPELSAVTLRNQLGQIMKQEQLRTPDTQMDWDISHLSTGTYFLEVRTSDGAPQVVKFLKVQ